MAVFLLAPTKDPNVPGDETDRREKLYSTAGLVAKLGLLFSEYAAHVGSDGGAIAVVVIEALSVVMILVVAVKGGDRTYP